MFKQHELIQKCGILWEMVHVYGGQKWAKGVLHNYPFWKICLKYAWKSTFFVKLTNSAFRKYIVLQTYFKKVFQKREVIYLFVLFNYTTVVFFKSLLQALIGQLQGRDSTSSRAAAKQLNLDQRRAKLSNLRSQRQAWKQSATEYRLQNKTYHLKILQEGRLFIHSLFVCLFVCLFKSAQSETSLEAIYYWVQAPE